jgi:hypothetical protein
MPEIPAEVQVRGFVVFYAEAEFCDFIYTFLGELEFLMRAIYFFFCFKPVQIHCGSVNFRFVFSALAFSQICLNALRVTVNLTSRIQPLLPRQIIGCAADAQR